MSDAPRSEQARLPIGPPPTNHGNTPAAWVTVVVVLVGALVSSLAMIASLVWLVWVGLGVIVVGLLAGRIMRMAGFGQPVARRPEPGDPAASA